MWCCAHWNMNSCSQICTLWMVWQLYVPYFIITKIKKKREATFAPSNFIVGHKHKIVVAFSNTQKFWSSPTSKSWKSIFLFIRLLQCQLSSSQLAILPRLDDRMVSARMHYSMQYWIAFGMTCEINVQLNTSWNKFTRQSCVQINFCDLKKKVSKTANGAPYKR